MKARISQLQAWVDGRSLRERMLLLGIVLAVIYSLCDVFLLAPVNARQQQLNAWVTTLSETLQTQQQQLAGISAGITTDPNVSLRDTVEHVNHSLESYRTRLDSLAGEFILPSQMAQVLRDMLTRNGGLRLVRLESLEEKDPPATDGVDDGNVAQGTAPEPPAFRLFRHGLVVEFEGSYLDAYRYLQAMEQLPWRFFWKELEFDTVEYPRARVRITIHTLSFGEGWISV